MRRPEAFSNSQYEDMSCSKSPESGVESHLHHMIKILNSSQCGKKSQLKKSFGIPLKDLIRQQSDDNAVPFVVTRLCGYIELHGLKCKGLFRLSGHIKTVESLKMSFETQGDANLEEIGDVIAAASLLKMFFRELPETIIPCNMANTFAETYSNNATDRKECVRQLKHLLEQLPEENFMVLRYLVSFLTRVASNAEDNCMNSVSLGIVFGPNIFRAPDNIQGMQLTSVINQVMTAFIESYSALFESDNDQTPVIKQERAKKIVTDSALFQDVSMLGNESTSKEKFSLNLPVVSTPADGDGSNGVIQTPPSLIDSDSDISSSSTTTSTSPNVAVVSTEFVEMTISKSVSEHLFGKNDEATVKEQTDFSHPKPHHAPHSDFQDKCIETESAAEDDRSEFSEMKRICSADHQVPKVCIVEETNSYAVSAIPDMKRHGWNMNLDEDYHETKRSFERSQLFQRMPSKVRRTRKNVRKSHSLGDLKDEIDRTDEDSLKENENHDHPDSHHKHLHKMGHKKTYAFHRAHRDGCTSHSLDFDPDTDRPSHPFLELHPQIQSKDWNSDDLPVPSPEPLASGHLRASWPLSRSDKISDEIMLSPRAAKLKNISSDSLDPDIPPSPPVEQDAFSKAVLKEDNVNMSLKQLNKKIYNLKKKIKHFEEEFEETFGYRPSHGDKMAQSHVKKYVLELTKARKDVKHMRDEALKSGLAPFFSQSLESPDSCQSFHEEMNSPPLNGHNHSDSKLPATDEGRNLMEDSLDEMILTLSEKRRIANRPEDLDDMNRQQVLDEKIAIQKSLLQYESVYGRPTSRLEKDVMRPIYDRYRNVKRLLAKQCSMTKDQGTELQPILEHETMEFFQSSPQHRPAQEQETNEASQNSEEHSTSLSNDVSEEITTSTTITNGNVASTSQTSCNLHELTLPELLTQQHKVKGEKKRLRRILHDFENEFQRQSGRRVQREDRIPLENIYGEYKQVKAKLRLLEALLSKHDFHLA